MPLPENNILFYWTAPKHLFFVLEAGADDTNPGSYLRSGRRRTKVPRILCAL